MATNQKPEAEEEHDGCPVCQVVKASMDVLLKHGVDLALSLPIPREHPPAVQTQVERIHVYGQVLDYVFSHVLQITDVEGLINLISVNLEAQGVVAILKNHGPIVPGNDTQH